MKQSSEFLNAYNAKNIVHLDLIMTDKPGSFQHTNVFETGISDQHKLVTTVLKAKFTKASPKYVHYCNYKNFNEEDFKLELIGKLEVDVVDANYETFHNVYLKAYRKAVMKRSELKTKYLKNSTLENFNKFRKQKNFCSRLYKKGKSFLIN